MCGRTCHPEPKAKDLACEGNEPTNAYARCFTSFSMTRGGHSPTEPRFYYAGYSILVGAVPAVEGGGSS